MPGIYLNTVSGITGKGDQTVNGDTNNSQFDTEEVLLQKQNPIFNKS